MALVAPFWLVGFSGCVREADRKAQQVYLPTNGVTRS
jgi:hypothetical protein